MTEVLASIPLLAWWATPLAVVVAVLVVGTTWWRHTQHLRPRTQALLVGIGLVVGVAAWLAVDVVWHPVADGVGPYVWAWVGILGFVVAQAFARPRRPDDGHRMRRSLGVLLGGVARIVVAALAALLALNAHFAAFPSLAAALGVGYDVTTLDQLPEATVAPTGIHRPDGPLIASWQPPANLPLAGRVITATIPASDPAFTPRPALAYLPPAYLTAERPLLPVLVLLAGQPGEPRDWLTAGRLQESMDAYAATHGGLAPVIVIPDPLGDATRNPLCSDADLGDVATYLHDDVPAWIAQNLQVDPDRTRWAIAGLSNGGTCALQAVTRDPAAFPTFLDMSGELHPTLGSEQVTIDKGFGGDRAAYEANDPLTLLGQRRYDGVHGVFSAGESDTEYLPAARELKAAADAAGMTTELRTYPGTHSWAVWSQALADQVGWLGDRLGLTA